MPELPEVETIRRQLAPLVEDLIKVLDEVSNTLRRGRYPRGI